jgi:hypothetical protein
MMEAQQDLLSPQLCALQQQLQAGNDTALIIFRIVSCQS